MSLPQVIHAMCVNPNDSMCIRYRNSISVAYLLLGLEVVEEHGALLRLLTPILNDNAGAVDNLACVTLTVQNT